MIEKYKDTKAFENRYLIANTVVGEELDFNITQNDDNSRQITGLSDLCLEKLNHFKEQDSYFRIEFSSDLSDIISLPKQLFSSDEWF